MSQFGQNGVWVRIGTMMPNSPELTEEFQHLIDEAPALRDKEFVVIDVRGNPGGTYNWFMGFLRGFYGQEYADYYARARLEIANTLMTVSASGSDAGGMPEGYDSFKAA